MQVVLLRVGVDAGAGGMQGPLFHDYSFELIPIPDTSGLGSHTYGAATGTRGLPLSEYFPAATRHRRVGQTMHWDPEFETHTYGDPTRPKAGLRRLQPGDMLVFYAGLEGWGHHCPAALYVVGYFVVQWAGLASTLPERELHQLCGNNFHVRHWAVLEKQRERLVLVKGGPGSRLLTRAHCISTVGINGVGSPLKVLSPQAREVFSNFDGKVSIQRSPPRWVPESHVYRARAFVESLP
ncbi:Nmad3 family putative nucleotide modification protein [Noviherbaspirillum pedocola]|uniref:Nucleotide modification associated domain-containing protein n=1 Tax=Noviherbaspirillum pedocola TaxID=2801341 RepID=A0A934T2I7_9BURK|nr:hypothetical protein [Noviherbaspirillum pedocola]MBK4736793.1 hypothetical protein [Noviherbaspirillum pedocola]